MKRIDTLNARPNLFGVGKAGFHDNADLPGQDATYLSPDWLNHLQEELSNVLELNGVSLDPESKQQLFNLLITRENLVNSLNAGGVNKALAAESMKTLVNMFSAGTNHFRVPRKDDLNNPWIIQFNFVSGLVTGVNGTKPYNFSFPNGVMAIFCSQSSFGNSSKNSIHLQLYDKNGFRYWVKQVDAEISNDCYWLAIGW